MSAEIQRIQDAEAPVSDGWEVAISEWETGVSQELLGALRQMRAAAYVKQAFGRAGLDKFGVEVGAGKSKVYAYAACFEALAETYQDTVSERLESAPLSPWQLVAAVRRGVAHGNVDDSISRAALENTTVREMNAQANGKPEEIESYHCPACGADSKHWQRVPGGVD
jgi:hypothetical protein